ncbi:MAG: Hypothetical protein BHV28_03050 [Candidatus Tokpelaia hoelldobleri]|uniref:Phage infection protein n=1 Tax=Candidatus Tokpelaia hoelldobleri TaxID=1902579 RepID=A0A1U9JT25_9HYPH|nr:MAG: Hypothetical protein BHV28_03050 [Candidatus Tokpelaia hoelldoblerii]
MQSIEIKLEHCYGITALCHSFSFKNKRQNVVYAPNGVMKSSLALTFKDVSEGKESCDRIHKNRETRRSILDENKNELTQESIFVVEPYREDYKSNRMSTLLANNQLRDRYDNIRREIDEKKDILISNLKPVSGLKNGIEEILANDVTNDPTEFFTALRRLKTEVDEGAHSTLADLRYAAIFSTKVVAQLESKEFRSDIEKYMRIYDTLITKSTFFRKGAFNHNDAAAVAKSLEINGFFKADHSVYVNNKNIRQEIKNKADLERVIQEEKDEILGDKELKAQFEKIDKLLTRNADMKDFRAYLTENEKLIPELSNPDRLRQRLWIAYLSNCRDILNDALDTYEQGREELERIITEAKNEGTHWAEVLKEFNDRFSVPFVVTMENQHDVILKADAPSIRFRFKGHNDTEVPVAENDLIQVLSNGERRALYLLNIIFEVIARREEKIETLFIFDDIADSFDYKNKYAIIEYLRDITKIEFFYQIILTHNYDFYRTISKRLDLGRNNKFHALRNDKSIQIRQEKYQNNPFTHWKNELPNGKHDDFLLAMIPFVRNIAEFSGQKDIESKLTKYLHVKSGSQDLTIGDLEALFKKVITFNPELSLPNGNKKIFELLFERADQICTLTEEKIELETKIVLAMAIRLRAELFMIGKINDENFLTNILNTQTFKLFEKVKETTDIDPETLKYLEQVILMTPENIHINSFMYEPILDMSNHHLKRLYKKIKTLAP